MPPGGSQPLGPLRAFSKGRGWQPGLPTPHPANLLSPESQQAWGGGYSPEKEILDEKLKRARLEIHWIPNGSDLSCSTSNISGGKTNRLLRKDNTLHNSSCRLGLAEEVGRPPRGEPGQAARGACLSRRLQAAPVTASGMPLPCPCPPPSSRHWHWNGAATPAFSFWRAQNCSLWAPEKARQPRTSHADFYRNQRSLRAQCQALDTVPQSSSIPLGVKASSSPDRGLAEPPAPTPGGGATAPHSPAGICVSTLPRVTSGSLGWACGAAASTGQHLGRGRQIPEGPQTMATSHA